MNTSIYAAPKADLTMPHEASGEEFYVVSQRKFLVMFLVTLGYYKIYWFYKNWSMYKAKERAEGGADSDIWPVPRAIFSVFFVHALLREAFAHAGAKQRTIRDNFDSTATVIVALMIVASIADRLSWRGIGSPFTDIISVAILLPLAWNFNNARQFINDACGDPAGKCNATFTWANWIWIIIGSLIWLMAVLGLFVIATGMKVD